VIMSGHSGQGAASAVIGAPLDAGKAGDGWGSKARAGAPSSQSGDAPRALKFCASWECTSIVQAHSARAKITYANLLLRDVHSQMRQRDGPSLPVSS
jgi:hypothetical protein